MDFINLSTLLNLKDFINRISNRNYKTQHWQCTNPWKSHRLKKELNAHHLFDVKMFGRSYIQFKPIFLAGPWIFAKLLENTKYPLSFCLATKPQSFAIYIIHIYHQGKAMNIFLLCPKVRNEKPFRFFWTVVGQAYRI